MRCWVRPTSCRSAHAFARCTPIEYSPWVVPRTLTLEGKEMNITSRYTDIPEVTIDRSKIPAQFERLLPLAKEWSMTDDAELDAYIAAASEAKRKELVDAFIPLLAALGEWYKSCEKMEPKPYELVLFDIAANAADTVQTKMSRHSPHPPLPPDVAVTNSQPPIAPTRSMHHIALCPVCGKDDKIQKVSAIVSTHQHSGTSSGSSVGLTYDGDFAITEAYTNLKTNSISALAKALFPPSEPAKPITGEGCASGLSCLGAIVFGLLAFGQFALLQVKISNKMQDKWTEILGMLLFGCISGFLIFWRTSTKAAREAHQKACDDKANAEYSKKKHAFETAMLRWGRMYYCHRDNIVFDPVNSSYCQPNELQQHLYKE